MSGAIQKGLVFVGLASFGLNGVLLLRSGASTPPTAQSPSEHRATASVPKAVTPQSRTTASEPTPQPHTSPQGVGAAAPEPETYAECESELSEAQSELQRYLPAFIRFERSEHDAKLEAEIRPKLLKNLDTDKLDLNVECRGRVCKIEGTRSAGSEHGNWQQAIQRDGELRDRICGSTFMAGPPTTDPTTGDSVLTDQAYLSLCDDDLVPGMPLLNALVTEFESAGHTARCEAEHPQRGILSLRIDIGPGGFEIAAGGDLAAADAGKCLSRALEQLATATEVPDKVGSAVLFHQITVGEHSESRHQPR